MSYPPTPQPEQNATSSIQTKALTHSAVPNTLEQQGPRIRPYSRSVQLYSSKSIDQPLFSLNQVEDIINRNHKRARKAVMTSPRDKEFQIFNCSLVLIKISKNVLTRTILEFNGVEYPIQYINKNKVFLPVKTCDDNQIVLLLPTTLSHVVH